MNSNNSYHTVQWSINNQGISFKTNVVERQVSVNSEADLKPDVIHRENSCLETCSYTQARTQTSSWGGFFYGEVDLLGGSGGMLPQL